MNQPGPTPPWHQRRPASDDATGIARTRPLQQRPQSPRTPPPPPARRPPSPEIPWYLQRPDRPNPPPPATERPTPTTEPKRDDITGRKRPQLWLLVGAGAVIVLIGGAIVLANLPNIGITGGTVLDVSGVQAGVLQTLSDPSSGYGANTVTDVSCNGGRNPSAAKGTTFVCDLTVNATQRHVSVLVSDDNGTYEIDRPR